MTNLSQEELKKLISKEGKLQEKIQKYWAIQSLRSYYDSATYLTASQKEKIIKKFDELSGLICNEITGNLQ